MFPCPPPFVNTLLLFVRPYYHSNNHLHKAIKPYKWREDKHIYICIHKSCYSHATSNSLNKLLVATDIFYPSLCLVIPCRFIFDEQLNQLIIRLQLTFNFFLANNGCDCPLACPFRGSIVVWSCVPFSDSKYLMKEITSIASWQRLGLQLYPGNIT